MKTKLMLAVALCFAATAAFPQTNNELLRDIRRQGMSPEVAEFDRRMERVDKAFELQRSVDGVNQIAEKERRRREDRVWSDNYDKVNTVKPAVAPVAAPDINRSMKICTHDNSVEGQVTTRCRGDK